MAYRGLILLQQYFTGRCQEKTCCLSVLKCLLKTDNVILQPLGVRKLHAVARNINRTADVVIESLMRGFIRTVLFFTTRLSVTGRENVPPTGPYIMVVNHMSKADPPLGRRFRQGHCSPRSPS